MEQQTSTNETAQEFAPYWAFVEIFGHQQFAGKISEQAIAGDKLLRVDVPPLPETRTTAMSRYHPTGGGRAPDGQVWQYTSVKPAVAGYTKLFGVKAIYALTPAAESTVRAVLDKERSSHAEEIEAVPDPSIAAIRAGSDANATGTADDFTAMVWPIEQLDQARAEKAAAVNDGCFDDDFDEDDFDEPGGGN